MTAGTYNAVRVGDLEVAMMLARELGAVPGRASLTLSQLQVVFGADGLDSAERERIDAALAAAGLHPEPAVLDAHPDEPLAFGSNGTRRRFARRSPAAPAEREEPAATGEASLPVGAILAGLLVPVLLASVAGWRFGIAFAGFGAIAAGFLLSRPNPSMLLRSGRTFLLAMGGLCVLSLLAAAALTGAR